MNFQANFNKLSHLGTLPDLLREVDKDIIDLGLCNEYWHNHPGGVSHSKFCTRVEDGRDSCNGKNGLQISSFAASFSPSPLDRQGQGASVILVT